MKKRNAALLFAGIFFAVMLSFSTCSNVFSPSNAAGQQGNVTVSLSAGPSGRTLIPSTLDFDVYEFTFTTDSYKGFFAVEKGIDAISGSFTFTVPVGNGYTLNVEAYKGTGEGKILAAKGNSSEPFPVNDATAVTIKLTGNLTPGGNGTFSYHIQYPSNSHIESFLLTGEGGDIDLLGTEIPENGVNVMMKSMEVTAGWYGLELDLKDEAGKIAYGDDIVVIYSDTTTFYGTVANPIVFSSAKFKDPPVVPINVGEQVDEWHGFDIEGWSHYWCDPPRDDESGGTFAERNYDPGMAAGYVYDTYTDSEGPWSDVLKVVPPAEYNGDKKYALAMTYDLGNGGTFSFSMWVKAEGGSADPIFCWLNTGGEDGDEYPYPGNSQGSWRQVLGGLNTVIPRDGQWHYLENTFSVWGNDEIGLLAREIDAGGLNGATIYIRGLELEYKGGTIITPPEDQGFIITPASIVLEVGETRQLKASSAGTVTWSSNSGAVTVTANGFITAVETGTAAITAASAGELNLATAAVRVIAPGTKKYTAISFDDGPNGSWTRPFMDVLEKYDATATFFLVGGNLPASGADPFVKEMFDRGHELGNHTLAHDSRLGNVEQAVIDLQETQKRIHASTGKYPTAMRAPCLWYTNDLSIRGQPLAYAQENALKGIYDEWEWQYGESIQEAARKVGISLMDATKHQANDYDTFPEFVDTPEKYLNHVKYLTTEWGILLMHDSSPNTYSNLGPALAWLQSENYEILSIEKLREKRRQSGLSYYELEPGRIYYRFGEMYDHVKRITILKDSVAVSHFEEDDNLSKGMVTVGLGSTITLTADILTKNGGILPPEEIYWYSDNKYVVTVDRVTGVVSGEGWGSTTVRAVAGGKVASVTVTVDSSGPGIIVDIDTISTWAEFQQHGSISGADDPHNPGGAYLGSGAVVEIDSFHGFDDVVKLTPPPGGYNLAGIALTYDVPYTGMYTISADVFVESDRNDVTIQWYDCSKFEQGGVMFRYDNVKTGEWVTYTGSLAIGKNFATGLLTRRYEDETGTSVFGLRNSTVYIKDFKMELAGADVPVIDIVSPETSVIPVPVDKTVTLEWAKDGSLISGEGHLTVISGQKVTLTTKTVYPGYEWRVDGWPEPANTGSSFIFNSAGRKLKTYNISLWVDGDAVGDAVEITVVEAR